MINPFRLDGKLAVVTGAGKGIGRGIALSLAQAGADVVISARTESDLNDLAKDIEALGRKAYCVVADVTDTADLEKLVAAAGAVRRRDRGSSGRCRSAAPGW